MEGGGWGVKSRLRDSAAGPWVVELQFTLLGAGHILVREGVKFAHRKFIIHVIQRKKPMILLNQTLWKPAYVKGVSTTS